MTDANQVATPGFIRVVLPGAWAHVPLEDPERTRQYVRRLVRERVGREDKHASLRRDAVRQLTDLADKARSSEAHTLALALELLPGVPFAASMVGRDSLWPTSETEDEELETPARLAQAFPLAEIVEIPAGHAARWRESGVLRGKEEEAASISVSYRIPRPDSPRLLDLRLTGPDLGNAGLVGQLFDAIVASVEFTRERIFPEATA